MKTTLNHTQEEKANYLTHGFGLLLALIGFGILISLIVNEVDQWRRMSFILYGATLVTLFGASTLYHAIQKPEWKKVLRIIDHIAIYFLIAGTYTPFLLIPLRGAWGYTLLTIIWALAFLGTAYKLWFTGQFPKLSTGVYLGMGWLAVVAIKPMITKVPLASLVWLVAGGLLYSLGVIFYNRKSMTYHHAIWHLFVVAASTCHFMAISLYF